MFPLSRTKQIFAGLTILNLLLLVGFIGGYYFLHNRAASAHDLSREIDKIKQKIDKEEELESIIKDTATDRENLDAFFVEAEGTASFITKVESLAEDAGIQLEVSSVNVSTASGGDDDSAISFDKLVLDMQASGTWQQVIHFVRLLELLPKKIEVTDISLGQSGDIDSSSGSSWTATITITAHKLPGS